MLVLSRKLGEKIHIDEDVILTIVQIDRGKVRIGFEAPLHVKIMRSELVDRQPPDDAASADAA